MIAGRVRQRVVRRLGLISWFVMLAILGAACGEPGPTGSIVASPSGGTIESASASASAAPSATATSSPSAPPSLPAGVSVDPGLLEVLPPDVDGVPLQPDPDTAAQVGSDLLLAESARSIAVAIAVAPGTSDSADVAVASVIRLLPDVYDEAFFQEWRDTYDEAACEVADGVESEDETELGGRHVYTATCTGGATTYHTYLEDQNFIVSVTASGDRRFGELIMANLAG